MFGETPVVGFIPTPTIELHTGNLYSVVISFLVALSCFYSGWTIFSHKKERHFSYFLISIGIYWLLAALVDTIAWANLLGTFSWLVYPVKTAQVLPLLTLTYYFAKDIFGGRLPAIITALFAAGIASFFLVATFIQDLQKYILSYWGVQWQKY